MPKKSKGKKWPSDKVLDRMADEIDSGCALAAQKIAEADVLLLCTGAGFSADSGLAVYADVARVEAYKKRGLEYHDLCRPSWLEAEPELFWGFWGQCFNDYRNTAPHDGFRIIQEWVNRRFRDNEFAQAVQKNLDEAVWPEEGTPEDKKEPYCLDAGARPASFYAFTSNVDAHHFDWFRASEIFECHGNVEVYQCTARCDALWRAPVDYRFVVDKSTMLARGPVKRRSKCTLCKGRGIFDGEDCIMCDGLGSFTDDEEEAASPAKEKTKEKDNAPRIGQVREGGRPHALRNMPGTAPTAEASGFGANHPLCPHCGTPARPAILMFGDSSWRSSEKQWKRWIAWNQATKATMEKWPDRKVKAVILEFGAGCNVPTVRETSEETVLRWDEAGADACLVRVNPVEPWGDSAFLRTNGPKKHLLIPIMGRGLESIQKIDEAMPQPMRVAGGK